MTTWALKPNNNGVDDIYIANGSIALLSGSEQIRQSIQTRLRTFIGEYYLDSTYGIPYYETIFQSQSNAPFFESVLKANITAVQGVTSIASFATILNPSNRTYTVNFDVLDAAGEAINIDFNFGEL